MRYLVMYALVVTVSLGVVAIDGAKQHQRVGALEQQLAAANRTIAAVAETAKAAPSELERREAAVAQAKQFGDDLVYVQGRLAGTIPAPKRAAPSRR